MAGFLVKLVVCPTTVIISDLIFPQVYYPSIFQAILVGIILAVGAHTMEIMLLKKGTFWISTVMDFLAAAIIIFIVSKLLPGSIVTLIGALLTAFLLSITEYFQHLWILRTGRNKKSGQKI